MKDAIRKAAAAAAHTTTTPLRKAQVDELGKIVQRRQAALEALQARAAHYSVRPFQIQQKAQALAEAIAVRDAAGRRHNAPR